MPLGYEVSFIIMERGWIYTARIPDTPISYREGYSDIIADRTMTYQNRPF
jgi:hypothetical protein